MILATHVVVASAASAPFLENPLLCFFIGFVSHFLADAIPHWDWEPVSLKINLEDVINGEVRQDFRLFLRDVGTFFFDVAVGFVLVLAVMYSSKDLSQIWGIVAAAFGGVLPDVLQFFYFLWKKEPLLFLQRLHLWIHSKILIPHEKVLKGILLQAPVVVIALIFLKLFS